MADQRQAGSLWTPEEDVVLLRHVAKYGTKHWGYLQTSGTLPHRDQKACCNRFILLKRKFFQARAKGQRLTFPVVPQPTAPSSSGSPRSVPSTSPIPARSRPSPSSLKPQSSVSFKRSAAGDPSGGAVTRVSSLHLCAEAPENSDDVKSASADELSAGFHRAAEHLPERHGCSSTLQVPSASSLQLDSYPLQSHSARSKEMEVVEGFVEAMPGLRDVPVSKNVLKAQKADAAPAGSFDDSSVVPPHFKAESAVWRCFNPAADVCQPEVTSPLPETPTGLAWMDFACQEVPHPQTSLAPDAYLEQMASAPARLLFGHSSQPVTPGDGHGDAQSCAEGASWQSPAACLDLWDLLGTPASV